MRSLRLSLIASALVAAGCTTVAPPDNTYAFRPGNGTVQSVQEARVAVPGGTAPKTPLQDMTKPRWMDGYQLSLRMDDGTTQAITQDSKDFRPGDRVQITQEGRVLKASAGQASASAAGASTPWRQGYGTVRRRSSRYRAALPCSPASASASPPTAAWSGRRRVRRQPRGIP